jgi:hypothetical protein
MDRRGRRDFLQGSLALPGNSLLAGCRVPPPRQEASSVAGTGAIPDLPVGKGVSVCPASTTISLLE